MPNNGVRNDQWPTRYPGGKFYLAKHHIDLFPRHLLYVEPYAGGLQTLGQRDPHDPRFLMPGQKGVGEIVNDLDQLVTNFWRVVRDNGAALQAMCLHSSAENMFDEAFDAIDSLTKSGAKISEDEYSCDTRYAYYFFILMRMSMSARQKSYTPPTKTRLRGAMQAESSSWLGSVEGLTPCIQRMLPVNIVGPRDALEVIRQHDAQTTFFYLDPRYHPDVGNEEYRITAGQSYDEQRAHHLALLDVITSVEGKVMLCGYRNADYDNYLKRWRVVEFKQKAHSAKGQKKGDRVECVFMNYPPRDQEQSHVSYSVPGQRATVLPARATAPAGRSDAPAVTAARPIAKRPVPRSRPI